MPRFLLPALALLLCTRAGALSVAGTVTDPGGRPLAGVEVHLGGNETALARTDARGAWFFGDLGPGRYVLTARPDEGWALPARVEIVLAVLEVTGIELTVVPPTVVRIDDIQGAAHLSPLAGKSVRGVPGLVTALRGAGRYYVQSPLPDGDPATSEGIVVTIGSADDALAPGDLVLLDGVVAEVYEGDAASGGLPVTTIVSGTARRIARGVALPEPVVLGRAGRVPPDRVISNDAAGDVLVSPFDPAADGIDFYESLESMLVRVEEPLVVGPLHRPSGELWVVGDGGAYASGRSARGALVSGPGDQNPERIAVDLRGSPDILAQPMPPDLGVGARLDGPVTGILDYGSAAYRILPTTPLGRTHSAPLPRQAAPEAFDESRLTLATLNLENYGPGSTPD